MTFRAARRVVIGVIGATLALVGVALLVLPGPGLLVIALALGILAVEFTWARHWLHRLRDTANGVVRGAARRDPETAGEPDPSRPGAPGRGR